jgi:hypothetical protein
MNTRSRSLPELQWVFSWKECSCRTQKRRAFPKILEGGLVLEIPEISPHFYANRGRPAQQSKSKS